MNELLMSEIELEIREKFGLDPATLLSLTHLSTLKEKKGETHFAAQDATMLLLIQLLRCPGEEKERFMPEILESLKRDFKLSGRQLASYCGLDEAEFEAFEDALTAPLTKRETALLSLLHLKDLLAAASNCAQLLNHADP